MSLSSVIRLRPSDVHFSLGSIPQVFGKGRETIAETFRRLADGEVTADDIQPMTVFRHQSKFWAYSGNQHLYVFRKLEEFGAIDTIPVNVLSRSPFESGDTDFCLRKFTTVNGGRDVTVRGPDGCHMADTLAAIYRHSSMKRRQRLPAEIAAVQSQHVGNTGNGQSISPVPAKRRQADPTYLKVSLQQSPTTSKVDVTRKPPSPYPPSPAIIERILPYCVVVFVLLVISIVFLLFYLTL